MKTGFDFKLLVLFGQRPYSQFNYKIAMIILNVKLFFIAGYNPKYFKN